MAIAAAFPAIIAGVLNTAIAGAPAGTRVVRGRDLSGEVTDVVMIGARGIDDDNAGSFEQEFHAFGGSRLEEGHVNGIAYSRNGEGDQAAATVAAFTLIANLGASIRATPDLGVVGFEFVVCQFQTGDVQETQNDQGAVAVVSFAVAYKTRFV